MSETIEIKLQRVVRWSNEVQRTMGEMESEMVALHFAIDELRVEIKSIRAAAPPGVDHPPRAGADLTSPAPAVSLGAPRCMVPPAVSIDEEQRRSFAFGNCNIDNPAVTREMADRAAERMAFKPWARYYAEADTLCVLAGGALADIRTAPNGFHWRQSRDGGFIGCDIPNALDLLRDAGFERVATHDCEERMAASDEDDGA